jgi:hypothetical protein
MIIDRNCRSFLNVLMCFRIIQYILVHLLVLIFIDSQIYFGNETLHVSDSSSVHHQEFFTVHTAMVYVIQVCWELTSRVRMFHLSNENRSSVNVFITTMNSSVAEASTCIVKCFNETSELCIFLTLDIRGINDIRLISRPIHAPSHLLLRQLVRGFLSSYWALHNTVLYSIYGVYTH